MKTLHLLDTDRIAGTESHVLALAGAQRDLGVYPIIACCAGGAFGEEVRRQGLPILDLGGHGLSPKSLWVIRRAIRDLGIEILHAHNGRTSLIAAAAVMLAGRGRVVCTQHFIEPAHVGRGGFGGVVSRLAHRWVERRTARCIAISAAVRNAMLCRRDAAADKIVIVHNGIQDIADVRGRGQSPDPIPLPIADWPLDPALSTQHSALSRDIAGCRLPIADCNSSPFSIQHSSFSIATSLRLVCAARLEAEKDVGTLVEAMGIVVQRSPGAVCLIAGEGSQREMLTRRIAELNLQNNVRLLGFRADVHAVMAAGEVFVLPSPAEPFGLVLLEAMALGKPVIATAAGGPLEIVADGQSGLLVAPSDPKALASAICALAADPQRRSAMGKAGRERFEAMFTAKRMANDTLAVYRQALQYGCVQNGSAFSQLPTAV